MASTIDEYIPQNTAYIIKIDYLLSFELALSITLPFLVKV